MRDREEPHERSVAKKLEDVGLISHTLVGAQLFDLRKDRENVNDSLRDHAYVNTVTHLWNKNVQQPLNRFQIELAPPRFKPLPRRRK